MAPRRHRWADPVPASLGRKGHACVVVAPRRGVATLLRRDASHACPFRPIVGPLGFQTEPRRSNMISTSTRGRVQVAKSVPASADAVAVFVHKQAKSGKPYPDLPK